MNGRLLAMVVKELWAVLRDPKGRIILIVPPIVQLILFSAAATLEVKNVTLGIYNRDNGAASVEFVNHLAGSRNIQGLIRVNSLEGLRTTIDNQKAIAVIVFDETFSRAVAAGRPATVLAILDGRRSNSAQIVESYLLQIAASTGIAVKPEMRAGGGATATVNWFNPNLDYLWFIMPALLVQIGALSALSVTAQSVARERELGSFDQLMVSPLRTWEILIGKMTPPFIVGMFNATVYVIVIPLWGVPFAGSLLLFYSALILFLLSVIGIGMAISAVSQTQQQAFLGMFMATVPMILLSGFTSPVENMPDWLQFAAELDPLKHFLVIGEGIFLKDMTAADVWTNAWPIALIALVTTTIAVWQFRERME